MTNRERIIKTVRDAFECKLKEADDEELAMIADDLIDCGYCGPITSKNLLYFDEIHNFLQNEGGEEEDEANL